VKPVCRGWYLGLPRARKRVGGGEVCWVGLTQGGARRLALPWAIDCPAGAFCQRLAAVRLIAKTARGSRSGNGKRNWDGHMEKDLGHDSSPPEVNQVARMNCSCFGFDFFCQKGFMKVISQSFDHFDCFFEIDVDRKLITEQSH
jgi:hypothetical protein